MEQNSRNILFIDDYCDQYVSTMEIGAAKADFKLFSTKSVLDGLAFLNDYDNAVDVVILDLGFPENEMQGTDALKEIKRKYPHLPVIVLTDSDSAADIQRVVECMKNGAYSYVGKKTLNLDYFFQLVNNASQQGRLLNYMNSSTRKKDVETIFTIKDTYVSGRYSKRAVFGFELASIDKPSNEDEEKDLKINALIWHKNLLESINTPYNDSLHVNLKYIAENYQLKCQIIFSVYAENDDELNLRVADTQHDIKAFFNATYRGKNNPYLLENITDVQILRDVIGFSPYYEYNLFFRTPLKIGRTSSIGFTPSVQNVYGQDNSGSKTAYQPKELFPIPTDLSFSNELFRALRVQQHYTEIDVQIIPKKLLVEEIDMLRQMAKNPSLIEGAYSPEEKKQFANYLIKFASTNNDKFLVSVLLKREGKKEQQHVKTAVQRYFFGNAKVQSDLRNSSKIERFKIDAHGDFNQLPFFYSLDETLQAFRFPLPEREGLSGITVQPVSFTQFPKNLSENGIQLGEKKTVNGMVPIRIREEDLARHLYILGQTGTGKTTLLKSMIKDCLDNNVGFAVFDPHGDLYNDLLKILPDGQKHKLITLNTSESENSAKHNPLLYDKDNLQGKSLVINELFRIFNTLYDLRLVGGPIFELYFKNGMKLIMDEGVQEKFGASILSNFVDVFYNDDVRHEMMDICTDKSVVSFFKSAESTTGEASFNNFAPYIVSKVNRFTDDFYLSPIIMSKDNNINFRQLIDDGNILIVKLDKGKIGADNTSLLGQMLLSSIILAAMSRGEIDKTKRKPFYLFIDEFQNFIKGDIASALSEVRKYGLSLILANQTLAQLRDRYESVSLIDSLLGNVGSMVFFRPGISDYEIIRHYLEPEFKRTDVLKLPNFNCIARLLIDNVPSEPFVFQTKL